MKSTAQDGTGSKETEINREFIRSRYVAVIKNNNPEFNNIGIFLKPDLGRHFISATFDKIASRYLSTGSARYGRLSERVEYYKEGERLVSLYVVDESDSKIIRFIRLNKVYFDPRFSFEFVHGTLYTYLIAMEKPLIDRIEFAWEVGADEQKRL